MDENVIVASELHQAKTVESAVNLIAGKAITSTLFAPHQFIAYDCSECGEPLLWFRMQRGLKTCVSCQSNIETGRNPVSRAR